jgi:hypothetical protein
MYHSECGLINSKISGTIQTVAVRLAITMNIFERICEWKEQKEPQIRVKCNYQIRRVFSFGTGTKSRFHVTF